MNRYILIAILFLTCICCINGKSYACNQDPVAILIGNDRHCIHHSIHFDGSESYDPDGYITRYEWSLYDYERSEWKYHEGSGWHLNPDISGPGRYFIRLTVYDDENGSDTKTINNIYVIKADIDDITEDNVSYGSGIDFDYFIAPDSGWTADDIYLSLFEWGYEMPFRISYEGTSPGEGCFSWDGKDDSNDYVPPGHYVAQLRAYHPYSYIPCFDEHGFYVVPEVGEIDIEYSSGSWDNVTDETIVVLKGTKYNFKALPNPSGAQWPTAPSWSGCASDTGETIYNVTFDSTGNYDLYAKCGTYDQGKKVTIKVVEPVVYQFGFGGDNLLYKTPTNIWEDGTDPITDPVYTPTKNDPVCVTKNSSISLTNVKLKVSEPLSYTTTITIDAGWISQWDSVNDVSFSGTTSDEISLNMSNGYYIKNEVETYDGTDFHIGWYYKVPAPGGTGLWIPTDVTFPTVYVIYDDFAFGGKDTTVKRIDWICAAADGATSEPNAADGIHDALGGDPPYEPDEKTMLGGGWLLMAGTTYGECDQQAGLMELAVDMLGVSGDTVEVHASTNSGEGNCLDFENRVPNCPVHGSEKLFLDFYGGGTWEHMNTYEGCCVTAGYYYAVWPQAKATNDYTMLQTLGNSGVTQHYCWYDYNVGLWIPCDQSGSTPDIP